MVESICGECGHTYQRLRVAAHGPAGEQDDDCGEDATFPLTAEPDADRAAGPPEHAHERVLQILVRPWAAVVLGKGIDDAPQEDDPAVEVLFRDAASAQPLDGALEHDEQDHRVARKCGAHDVVRETLAEVSTAAPRLERCDAKHHLCPAEHRECTAQEAVYAQHRRADVGLGLPREVQLEVDAAHGLREEREEEDAGHRAVHRVWKLAALVVAAQVVPDERQEHGRARERDMQLVPHEAEDHREGEEHGPCGGLERDVDPERGIDGRLFLFLGIDGRAAVPAVREHERDAGGADQPGAEPHA